MLLKCSADLQKALKIKADTAEETDRLFSWCAHTFKLNRRNCLAVMNCASRMGFILYGLKAKDYAELPANIPGYIRELLVSYGLSEPIIQAYLDDLGEVTVCRNPNRSDVARLNRYCSDASYFYSRGVEPKSADFLQLVFSQRLNRHGIYEENNHYWKPKGHFIALLKERYAVPLYEVNMLHLRITLDVPEMEISREIVVPDYFTFYDLHLVIQTCFNWQNYHSYEFEAGTSRNRTLIVPADMLDMMGDFGTEGHPAEEVLLSELLGRRKTLQYTYDLGDCWQHEIRLLDRYVEHENPQPKCLKATGKAPPEDCGGGYGYLQFLEQLRLGDAEMIEWSNEMKWKKQTAEEITHDLQSRFYD